MAGQTAAGSGRPGADGAAAGRRTGRGGVLRAAEWVGRLDGTRRSDGHFGHAPVRHPPPTPRRPPKRGVRARDDDEERSNPDIAKATDDLCGLVVLTARRVNTRSARCPPRRGCSERGEADEKEPQDGAQGLPAGRVDGDHLPAAARVRARRGIVDMGPRRPPVSRLRAGLGGERPGAQPARDRRRARQPGGDARQPEPRVLERPERATRAAARRPLVLRPGVLRQQRRRSQRGRDQARAQVGREIPPRRLRDRHVRPRVPRPHARDDGGLGQAGLGLSSSSRRSRASRKRSSTTSPRSNG